MQDHWMSIMIPLGVVLVLVVVLLIILRAKRRERLLIHERGKALQAAEAHSVWAGAEVISVTSLSGYGDTGKAGLKLRLKVSGAGDTPYIAAAQWLVDLTMLPQFQPGARLSVRVDPDHPEIIFPNMSGARYLGKG